MALPVITGCTQDYLWLPDITWYVYMWLAMTNWHCCRLPEIIWHCLWLFLITWEYLWLAVITAIIIYYVTLPAIICNYPTLPVITCDYLMLPNITRLRLHSHSPVNIHGSSTLTYSVIKLRCWLCCERLRCNLQYSVYTCALMLHVWFSTITDQNE